MFKFFLALIFLSIFSILRCSSSTQNTTVSDEEKNEKWMDQCLDHYSSDPRMWEMRYFENFEYYEQGGPIFILVGGEWEASHSFLESGHIHDMAKKFNATMFNTEHRYYGKSHPRNDTSRENLKWLTVEQALGDLFNFIRHIKRIHPELSEAKVIMFGVSYSGSLVTWFRQKHENVVDGVWSSSAPVYPDLKFVEGKKIVEDAIKQIGGRECLDRIHNAFVELQRLIKNGDNEKIEKDFPLCASLNTTDPREVWSFFITISEMIDIFVQDHTVQDIQNTCKSIMNDFPGDDVAALGKFVNDTSDMCLQSHEKFQEDHQNITWEGNKFMRQWNYQCCSQLGWFSASNTPNNIFGPSFSLSYSVNFCNDLFGGGFTLEGIKHNVENSKITFRIHNNLSNVYSTHGSLDGWRSLGIQKDINKYSPAAIIPNYGHADDQQSLSDSDSADMKASKCRIARLIKEWLKIEKNPFLEECHIDKLINNSKSP